MARGNFNNSFWSQQFPKWAGAAAMLGGVLWVVAAFLHSLEPTGCIGLECDTRAMRNTSAIVALVSFAALVLILVGVSGLMLLARQSGRHTKLATTGMFLVAFGLVMLLAGGLIQALFFSGDFPGMPFIVIPALLGVVVGLLLIGIFILRSDVLPRWLGVFFIVSSVALVAANEQTVAVLLFIPFGLAMAAAGYLMWAGGTQYATAPARGLKA